MLLSNPQEIDYIYRGCGYLGGAAVEEIEDSTMTITTGQRGVAIYFLPRPLLLPLLLVLVEVEVVKLQESRTRRRRGC